jgi:modulator of FtsH protease
VSGYLTAEWTDFSVAVVGASAALTGLLFVAVSINIEQILAVDALAGRALSTMILFVVPLVVGTLVLVPGQSPTALGLELIGTGVVAGGGLLRVNRPGNRGELEPRSSWLLIRFVPSVTITVFLLLAGTTLIAQAGGGLYWVAPAIVEAFVGGLVTVWVLLVEIRR